MSRSEQPEQPDPWLAMLRLTWELMVWDLDITLAYPDQSAAHIKELHRKLYGPH